jgi:hypothetical protein
MAGAGSHVLMDADIEDVVETFGSSSITASGSTPALSDSSDADDDLLGTDSEDDIPVEEFRADEQEQADTTSQQLYEAGKDQQGIPWERLQVGTLHTRTPAAVLQDTMSTSDHEPCSTSTVQSTECSAGRCCQPHTTDCQFTAVCQSAMHACMDGCSAAMHKVQPQHVSRCCTSGTHSPHMCPPHAALCRCRARSTASSASSATATT